MRTLRADVQRDDSVFDFSNGGNTNTISKKLEASSNIRDIIMRNSSQERFRSLVRDTSLPPMISLVYLKATTAYVRSKLLAQHQWANTRAVVA